MCIRDSHQGGSARAVDDEHDLLAGLDADVLEQGIDHDLGGLVGGLHGLTATAALAVLAHTDLHVVLAQVGQSGAGGGMGSAPDGHEMCIRDRACPDRWTRTVR